MENERIRLVAKADCERTLDWSMELSQSKAEHNNRIFLQPRFYRNIGSKAKLPNSVFDY